jgi:hypothetical protein
MPDPVTIGTLAASALALAGDETVKGFVGETVKDAYKTLRDKIARLAGGGVYALEKAPASKTRQRVVAKAINGQSAEEQISVKALAPELLAALKREAQKREGSGPIGLDVGKLEALEVDLAAITVNEGVGVRIKKVTTPGPFKAGPIKVGSPPRKKG